VSLDKTTAYSRHVYIYNHWFTVHQINTSVAFHPLLLAYTYTQALNTSNVYVIGQTKPAKAHRDKSDGTRVTSTDRLYAYDFHSKVSFLRDLFSHFRKR